MFGTLKAQIKTLLETLTWTDKPFVEIFDFHTMENSWYPYVSFEPTNFQANILDNCNNMRTYNFDIIIYQEISKWWRQQALDIVIKWIEDIISLFDSNYTLNWLALGGTQPLSCDFFTLSQADWNTIWARLRLACNVIQSIN